MPDEHNSTTGPTVPLAAPAGETPAATAVIASDLLDGRYRLRSLVAQRGPVALWRGDDLVLARAVAVRALAHAESESQAERLLSAAVRSGRLVHPGAASTYDATTTETRSGPVTYVVSEWVDGTPLNTLLDEGPLSPDRSVRLVLAVARVLAAAHARDIAHGDLHPGDVVLTPHGGVKVLDLEVRAALADDAPLPERRRRDVVALGGLLYACLTGRWPFRDGRGLPPAPTDAGGQLCTPRQVRAGVPRNLDGLTLAALGDGRRETGTLATAAQVVDALETVPTEPGQDDQTLAGSGGYDPGQLGQDSFDTTLTDSDATSRLFAAAHRRERRPTRNRRRRIALLAGVLLVAAAGAWFFGVAMGRLPGPAARIPALNSTGNPPGPALTLTSVTSFDPRGDGSEQDAKVGLAHDGDPATAWPTDTYSTANLGNLKPGVGLLVDLGHAESVRQVKLTFASAGQSVQLRAADSASNDPDAFAVVAQSLGGGTDVVLTPSETQSHRFWIIWLTQLPPADHGFRAELRELAFLS